MENKNILKKKCPYCGKVIYSLYPTQLEYNYTAHVVTCSNNPANDKEEKSQNGNNKKG